MVVRSIGRSVAIALLVVACAPSPSWERIASGSPSARGFAASACTTDGALFVWGGGLPGGGPAHSLGAGGGLLVAGEWRSIDEPPLELRLRAGAVAVGDKVAVWGGANEVAASQNLSDIVVYDDGAIYSLATSEWRLLSPSPLEPRILPRMVAVGDRALVYGGQLPPGLSNDRPTTGAAFIDPADGSWTEIAEPPPSSVISAFGDGLLAFSAEGVATYQPDLDQWTMLGPAPVHLDEPEAAVGVDASTILVLAENAAWLYDVSANTFEETTAFPGVHITTAASVAGGVVVWDETTPALSLYSPSRGEWIQQAFPQWLESREGTASCISNESLIVWGGWIHRTNLLLGSDSGAIIDLELPTDATEN